MWRTILLVSCWTSTRPLIWRLSSLPCHLHSRVCVFLLATALYLSLCLLGLDINFLCDSLGIFDLSARSYQAEVMKSKVEDPLDDGRSRIVTFSSPNATTNVAGTVSWLTGGDVNGPSRLPSPLPPTAGRVHGETQSAKALLELGDPSDFLKEASRWPSGCSVGDG